MKTNKRIGISLIVLVITIIIIIILAGAIILSLSEAGIISNAQKSSFQNDIKIMQEELAVYISSMQLESRNKYKKEELFADKNSVQENGSLVAGKTIQDIITSIDNKYLDKIEIVSGELVYTGDSLSETSWTIEVLSGIKGQKLYEKTNTEKHITLEETANLNLVNYRIYGNSVEKVLPEEYQRVEYIESTGTQYIITNYYANDRTRVVVDYQYTSSENSCLFGARAAYNLKAYAISNSGTDFLSAYDATGSVKFSAADTERHIIDKNRNQVYLDGELKLTHPDTTFHIGYYMEIFSINHGGTSGYLPASAKIYSFKIYDEDIIIRDFIPCYRKSDNEIGLYDLVYGNFYTNKGEGIFEKGADITKEVINVESVGDLVEHGENKDKYSIPVIVTGKNLLDVNKYYSNWTNNEGGINYTNLEFSYLSKILTMRNQFKENTQYTWSFDYELTSIDGNGIQVGIYYSDGTRTNGSWLSVSGGDVTEKSGHYKIVSEAGKTINYIYLSYGTSTKDCNIKLSNIMVEEGTTETKYEPYIGKEYKLYLDEPLRKIGDYADYIDFRTQEVVRNVKVIDDNGTLILEGLETPSVKKISLSSLLLNEGLSKININTMVAPSKVETIYYTN